MQFTMNARIDLSEFHNNKHYTVVTTPAKDAFSHPARFKLQSDQPLGAPQQNVEVTVEVGGIVRPNPFVDKKTGQQKVFQQAEVYLNVISARPIQQPAPLKAADK